MIQPLWSARLHDSAARAMSGLLVLAGAALLTSCGSISQASVLRHHQAQPLASDLSNLRGEFRNRDLETPGLRFAPLWNILVDGTLLTRESDTVVITPVDGSTLHLALMRGGRRIEQHRLHGIRRGSGFVVQEESEVKLRRSGLGHSRSSVSLAVRPDALLLSTSSTSGGTAPFVPFYFNVDAGGVHTHLRVR